MPVLLPGLDVCTPAQLCPGRVPGVQVRVEVQSNGVPEQTELRAGEGALQAPTTRLVPHPGWFAQAPLHAQGPPQLEPTPRRVSVSDTPAQLWPHAPAPGVQVRRPVLVNATPLQTSGPRGLQVHGPTVRGVTVPPPGTFRVCVSVTFSQLQLQTPQPCDPSTQVRVRDWSNAVPEQTEPRAGLHAP